MYDNSGALATVTDSATGIKTTYYYDFLDRMMKYVESGNGYSHSVGYEYDTINNLTKLVETINGVKHTTSYTYDKDNRVTTVNADGKTVSYTYDSYGRVTQQVTKNGSTTVLTEYFTYRAPTTATTTGQIATYRTVSSGYDVTYTYTYDDNGNILSISDGTNTTSYVYDTANQLVRENNQAKNYTHTWTYDDAGNILDRKEYAYTTGTLGTVIDTITYAYGNTDWGDLLNAYDGQTISYDTIGNPTDDGTWEYTWQHGRQLASMTDGTNTWYYTYNADGLRTNRNHGATSYDYIYNGDKLTQMDVKTLFGSYDGTSIYNLSFTYDANGTPLAVTCDTNTTDITPGTYYYVTNIQGDVVGILDGSGNQVVGYTYDAWGNILETTGSMATTLGFYNPLRYRSYVYDQETNLYYLQSRYYDPETGRFINADSYTTTGQGLLGNNMFMYCLNSLVMYCDSSGKLAVSFFLDTILGDGSKKEYGERSKIAKALKKSAAILDEFHKNVEKFIQSKATQSGMFFGSISTYNVETLNDRDLSLTVGRARYSMVVTKEVRTKGVLWWRKEQTRYVADVVVSDSYDFTEWFEGDSFGSIMNNIAYIGQVVGVVVPYNWKVSFTLVTEWEDSNE